ncbi:MAG TPA: hypothetical protein VNM40_02585 [Candidatus Paceibacterota bacterium]|nr:hypothetical protein [Candidatus Paceibacterota bacterium]
MTYKIFLPGKVDEQLFRAVCAEFRLDPDGRALMLPFGSPEKIGWETRRLYFDLARREDGFFNTEPQLRHVADIKAALPVTRIMSFGKCNVSCPYCKRDCQFRDENGKVIIAMQVALCDLFGLAEGAYARGETVRFSGGDPVVFPKETLAIASYMRQRYGAKVSIAHNGSGPAWVRKLAPDLSSAAVDLKAVPEKMGHVMGVSRELGERIYTLSEESQKILSDHGVVLDVRTPVFGDTTLDEMRRLAETLVRNNPRTFFWTWRLYKAVHGCDWAVPQKDRVFEMLDRVSAEFPTHWMGMRAKWEGGGMAYWFAGHRLTPMETDDREERGSGNIKAA